MRHDGETFQPLGPAIPKEVPQQPEWVPTGTPGIERTRDGKLRNVTPTPPEPYVPYLGTPSSWGLLLLDAAQGAECAAGGGCSAWSLRELQVLYLRAAQSCRRQSL